MKILAVIANHGTGNDRYLAQLLDEYRAMPHDVRIVVTSNLEKTLGPDVEVRVGLPTPDPWSLPFAHQQIFFDHADDFDLFIYSEDDILITDRNVEAFLRATEVLPDEKIAGFLRTETDPDGKRFFPDVHSSFHWLPGTVAEANGIRFAAFSCEHSGCYIVTRQQLKAMIESGGFPARPRKFENGMAETAATDCYTQCGLSRVICYSLLEDFLVPHLSNKYLGSLYDRSESEFQVQIHALDEIYAGQRSRQELLNTQTRLPQLRWSKDYYEPVRTELLDLIGEQCRSLLSVGCGWGQLERACLDKGIDLVAIPLDAVIGKCAEARNVRTLSPSLEAANDDLRGLRFDRVIVSNVLHLVADPEKWVRILSNLLDESGAMIVAEPNISTLRRWMHRAAREGFEELGDFEGTGVAATNVSSLKRILRSAGLTVEEISTPVPAAWSRWRKFTLGLADQEMAPNVYLRARRTFAREHATASAQAIAFPTTTS